VPPSGAVASASGAASVRVWHITSRGWDPWTGRPLPEVVRVAYPLALPPGRREPTGPVPPRGRPRGGHERHGNILLGRAHADRLERLGEGIAGPAERVRLRPEGRF